MKEIKAYVRRTMTDHVSDALARLSHLEVGGVAVVRLQEFGHADGDGTFDRTESAKVEIVVPDHVADSVVDAV